MKMPAWSCAVVADASFLLPSDYVVSILWCPCLPYVLCFSLKWKDNFTRFLCHVMLCGPNFPLSGWPQKHSSPKLKTTSIPQRGFGLLEDSISWFPQMCFYLWVKVRFLFLGRRGNFYHCKSYGWYHSASLWQEMHHCWKLEHYFNLSLSNSVAKLYI